VFAIKSRKPSGFTLIELLVVIAIIGILSTLAVVSLNMARVKARDAVRRNDMNQIGTAMQLYYGENNDYPLDAVTASANCGTAGVLANAVNDELCGGSILVDVDGEEYFKQIPEDPTNTGEQRYIYDDQSAASTYCIEVNLEGTADTDDDDWFICKDGACYPSLTDCDG